MPLSSLLYPGFFPLEDSNNRIQAAALSERDSAFFEILTKLINSSETFLLNKATDHNNAILSSLKEIWEDNGKPMPFTRIQNEYEYIFDQKNSYYIDSLTSIIVTARLQYLKTRIKNKTPSEENQVQFIKETQKRINFMIQIAHLFSKKLFASEITTSFHYFLLNIFSDILSITTNISNGLFNEAFPNHYKDLIECFEQVKSIAESFAQVTYTQLSNDERSFNFSCKLTISTIIAKSTIEYARYYFAIGDDEQAFLFLEPFNQEESEENNTEQNFFIKQIKKIKPDKDTLLSNIERNPKRDFYQKTLQCLKKTGFIEAEKDLEPRTKEVYQTAITNNTLTEALGMLLSEILQYYNDPNKPLDNIPQSIMLIGLIAQKDYYNNIEISESCKLIFENAEKILTEIIDQDETSVIAIYIREYLTSYTSKVNFFTPSFIQSYLKPPVYSATVTEEKQTPSSFEIAFPKQFSLPNTKSGQNFNSSTFFIILCELISSEDSFSNLIKQALKINIDKIWSNNAITFTALKEISILIKLCSEKKPLKTLISLILQARNYTIDIHTKIPLNSEEEQFEYFKETEQRFNFMLSISSIVGKKIDEQDFETEAHYFLMSVCSDVITNAKNISKGLFLEHFKKHLIDLSVDCKNAIFIVNRVLKSIFEKKWLPNNPNHLFDIKMEIIDWPLYYAQYYAATGRSEAAIEYLDKSTKVLEYQGNKKKRNLLKTKHKDFLKQKEALYTHIQTHYQRKIYSQILDYFNESNIAIQGILQDSLENIEKQLSLVYQVHSNHIADIKKGILALRLMQEKNYNNDPNLFRLSEKILVHFLNLFDSKKNPGNFIILKIESYFFMHQAKMHFQPISNIEILKQKVATLKAKNEQLNKKHTQVVNEQEQETEYRQKEIEKLEQNLPNLNKKIETIQEQSQDTFSKIKPCEEHLESLKQENLTIYSDLDNIDKTVKALQSEITELEKKHRFLSRTAKKAKTAQLVDCLHLVTIKELEKELASAKQQELTSIQALVTVETELKARHTSMQTIEQSSNDFIKKMDINIKDLNTEIAGLKEKMTQLSTENKKFTTIFENIEKIHERTNQRLALIDASQTNFFTQQSQDIQGFFNTLSRLVQHASMTHTGMQPVYGPVESVNTNDELKNHRRYPTS